MRLRFAHAELYLNDLHVGSVRVKGSDTSWTFGEFQPNAGFARFAELFARWSHLMHTGDTADRLSKDAADELRRTEYLIDRLRVRLHLPELNEWRHVRQLNIDGTLIDWKE